MTAPSPRTIVLAVHGCAGRNEPGGLCERLRALIERSGAAVAVCDIGAADSDAGTIDTLARLQLTAGRLGCEIRLRHATDELLELLSFMGLTGVLRLEVGGEAEEREQRFGVEEEAELDDPAG